ncbi:MAG: M50 family metallopeptidase [Acidimicrobiales bacterium]
MTEISEATASAEHPDRAPDKKRERPQSQSTASLVRLVVFLVAATVISIYTGAIVTVSVVAALIVMIMLHEAGHFVTAKLGGMKVTEFFVGFGPRVWSFRRGETEYGVKAIPAGGYVKIIGMHNLDPVEDPADEARTYRQQSFPKRLAVALAGSTVHFILAIFLLWVVTALVGIPGTTLQIAEITRLETGQSPAQEAGFEVGDRIVSVDGQRLDTWSELPPYIRGKANLPIEFVVDRGGSLVELTAVPADLASIEVDGAPAIEADGPVGFIGIGPKIANQRIGPVEAVPRSVGLFGTGVVETGRALRNIFSPNGVSGYFSTLSTGTDATAGDGGENRFLSPVGFVRVAGQAADQGLFEVLNLLILINIFVGIFNLLPLLPLDGGHVVIAVYEAIRSAIAKRRHFVDVAKLMPATYVVFILLVFIGVTSLYLDIVKPIANPFQ